jgi:hypothetical protein
VEYYRSPEGKEKKRMHNRHRQVPERADRGRPAAPHPCLRAPERRRFDACVVGYVGMVVSLIEGRKVREEEVVEMWVRAVRQHSMYRRRKIEYVLSYWNRKAQGP